MCNIYLNESKPISACALFEISYGYLNHWLIISSSVLKFSLFFCFVHIRSQVWSTANKSLQLDSSSDSWRFSLQGTRALHANHKHFEFGNKIFEDPMRWIPGSKCQENKTTLQSLLLLSLKDYLADLFLRPENTVTTCTQLPLCSIIWLTPLITIVSCKWRLRKLIDSSFCVLVVCHVFSEILSSFPYFLRLSHLLTSATRFETSNY